jgi:iron-sulfur cluster assembly accessory protein
MSAAPITLPITLTDAAARRLADLSQAEVRALMLRVAVDGGGCSGFQYRFDLVSDAEPEDVRIENAGQTALIDDVSLAFLTGSEIDFVDELAGSEFKVRNPNARSSCGCGVSFSV